MKDKDVYFEPLPLERAKSPQEQAQDIQRLLEIMRACMPQQFELAAIKAQLMKALYDECFKQGFTAEQALQIAIAKGV